MPHKLRFQLDGPPAEPWQHSIGLRTVLVKWLAAADPAIAEAVRQGSGPRSYTVSPLWPDSETGRSRCWFEVSLFDDALGEYLLAGLHHSRGEITLGRSIYRLAGWEKTVVVEWKELTEPPASDWRSVALKLHTPTAHHESGALRKTVVLPTPERYFGSWMDRWNHHAPLGLRMDDELLEIVEERVVVSSCRGQTRRVQIDPQAAFIGFTGEVTFTVLQAHTLPDERRRALATLARFGAYCGTGVQTQRGMGQTEVIRG